MQIDLEGVPLRTTLRLGLTQLGLAYVLEDGYLRIICEERATASDLEDPFLIVGHCLLSLVAAGFGSIVAPLVAGGASAGMLPRRAILRGSSRPVDRGQAGGERLIQGAPEARSGSLVGCSASTESAGARGPVLKEHPTNRLRGSSSVSLNPHASPAAGARGGG